MASSQSFTFVLTPTADPQTEAVAAALRPLQLSDAARNRACARLAVSIETDSLTSFNQPPELWWRFDEEGRRFLARGRWQGDGRLEVDLETWTEDSDEPDGRLGGSADDWAQAVAGSPELAADLLACLYSVSVSASTLVLAFDARYPEQVREAVLLTAFARAALPRPLRQTCSVTLPLGAPQTLVQQLHTRVVAYPIKPERALGEAWSLVSGQGGVLFSMGDGQNGGAKPDAGCRAYAAAAVAMATRGPRALARFARKVGLLGDELARRPDKVPFKQLTRLVEAVDSPDGMAGLVDEWRRSSQPDEYAALLEVDDWGPVSDSMLVELVGAVEAPLGGSALQAKAMLELGCRPNAAAADLLQGDPSDPKALQHAVRLVGAGLVTADLPAEWHAPLARELDGAELAKVLAAALAQGAAARPFSLALLDRARESGDPSIAPALREAKQAGRLNELDLAVKAEQAYDACEHQELGLLEGLLQQQGWRVTDDQKRLVVRAALSREARAVGPRLLFGGDRLRVPDDWLEEIVDCISELPAPERADLRTSEWAALWSAACRQDDLAERLAPRLDERMAHSPETVTRALVQEQSWFEWKAASRAPAAVRNRAAIEWLLNRGPRKPYLEEWKAAIEDIRQLDSESLRRLAEAAGKSQELFDAIPYFQPEQTADLIRVAPDDATRDLWAQLLDRFPQTDPYRPHKESAAAYVLAVAGGGRDEEAAGRRRALELAAAGDWRAAEEEWSALAQLSADGRLAAAAVGALRQGDLSAPCWSELAALPKGQAVAALLDFVRLRLTMKETTGLAGPLLRLFAARPNWLERSSQGAPALELLATVESGVGVVVPVMQIARLAAESGYGGRADWWGRLAAQARACPRHDGRPNPLENWEYTRACLYDRAASLPEQAAKLFRRALDAADKPADEAAGDAVPWPKATLR